MFEFGQFLRLLLWISLPIVVIAMLIATYIHYRNKRLTHKQDTAIQEGRQETGAWNMGAGSGEEIALNGPKVASYRTDISAEGQSRTLAQAQAEETAKVYQGLLWVMNKYEEYRMQMDLRIANLKEELASAEKRYSELLENHQHDLESRQDTPEQSKQTNDHDLTELLQGESPEDGEHEGRYSHLDQAKKEAATVQEVG